ncbi:MAG: hypothetical protein MJA31_04225 [Clostridia bacterium]|nr:hypothetical protein [Clostridia bacterium]
MIKNVILIGMLLLILLSFNYSVDDCIEHLNTSSKDYYVSNTLKETGSKNIVTGIYLDYRLFDSLFEAGILLIAVSGIIFMQRRRMKYSKTQIIEMIYMKNSPILICACRILYPFMLLFGFYVIINGHKSPGGGFQGGAILATAILITFFIDPEKITKFNFLVKLEKISFIGLLMVSSISLLTKGDLFSNFIVSDSINLKSIFLVLLNLFIGIKVALGLVGIFSTFIDEGRSQL